MNIITSCDTYYTPWQTAGDQSEGNARKVNVDRTHRAQSPFTFVVAALALLINPPDELPLTEPVKIQTL